MNRQGRMGCEKKAAGLMSESAVIRLMRPLAFFLMPSA